MAHVCQEFALCLVGALRFDLFLQQLFLHAHKRPYGNQAHYGSAKKHQNENGYYDIYFWHTLNNQPNVIKGDIIIATPVGQKIHVVPVPGAPEGRTPIADLFTVTPLVATIYQNGTTTENCKIDYEIACNPGTHTEAELEGNYLDLHFCIEIGNGERWIDLDSESIDFYRIILKKDWQNGGE